MCVCMCVREFVCICVRDRVCVCVKEREVEKEEQRKEELVCGYVCLVYRKERGGV